MFYEKEKQVAIAAAAVAAQLCEQVRRDIPEAMEKTDKSPVTVADYGSQAVICKALAREFPDDPVVGEEDAAALRDPAMADQLTKITCYVNELIAEATPESVLDWIDRGSGEVGQRYWTLDPIDGTKGFLRQEQYAIALALVEGGEVKVGVLACPALPLDTGETGALFVAVRGSGATVQPLAGGEARSIRVLSSDDPAYFRLIESVESSHGDRDLQNAVAKAAGILSPSVQMDSQAKYGVVASGRAAFYMRLPSPKNPDYRENIWDHAAGAIVVEEAGGRVTDMYGEPLNFALGRKMVNNRGVIASNGAIHDTILAVLREKFSSNHS